MNGEGRSPECIKWTFDLARVNTIRYSGSPLAFGFDEAGTTKSMTVFNLGGSDQVVDLSAPSP